MALVVSHSDRFRWTARIQAADKRTLSQAQKNILLRLASHLNMQTGRCDPSVMTLAKGTGTAERTVQYALTKAECLGVIERDVGGGRYCTTDYRLLLPDDEAETVHGRAPFNEETVHQGALFDLETVHGGAPFDAKRCTAVHPNSEVKENSEESIYAETVHAGAPLSRGKKGLTANEIDAAFEEKFWPHYPKRVGKGDARKAYRHIIKDKKATVEELKLGAMRYAAERSDQNPKFTKHAERWLNGECWLDEPPTAQPTGGEDATARSPTSRLAAIAAGKFR